jgi:hypothetical protein
MSAVLKRTLAERRALIYHITYEREALLRAAKQFRKTERRFDVEAALVHARNLIDFYWSPSNARARHPNGVYAVDYYQPATEWKTQLCSKSQYPSQLYDALSARVVHVSVERTRRDVTVAFPPDTVDRLVRDLEDVWKLFMGELVGTKWQALFQRRAAKWRQAK